MNFSLALFRRRKLERFEKATSELKAMTQETETRVLKDPIQYPIHPSLFHISQTSERKRTKSSLETFSKAGKALGHQAKEHVPVVPVPFS